jgi:predicted membrane channel-forming protein YqfA (hemolysin III family)
MPFFLQLLWQILTLPTMFCFRPYTPWWHCVFHDEYERINCWSHGLPATGFASLVFMHFFFAQTHIPWVVALFAVCAFTTHFFSALTHVYPDSHSIEKLDHIGITATIIGTPITALLAKEHGHLPTPLLVFSVCLVLAAFLRPIPRVIGFLCGGAGLVVLYGTRLLDQIFVMELLLYASGSIFFLRNDGHRRGIGLADHHFLHYFSTLASVLHIKYLFNLS